MSRGCLSCGFLVLVVVLSGCTWQLREVKSKTKFGPEIRNRGNRTSEIRWTTIEEGIEFKWDNGWTTGLSYRRRDIDNGGGGDDNRFLVEFSFPLWEAPAGVDAQARKIRILEQRLALLEARSRAATPGLDINEENATVSAGAIDSPGNTGAAGGFSNH